MANIAKCMGCKCFFETQKAITITYRNTPQDFCSVDCARIWLDEIERMVGTFSELDFLVMRWMDLQDLAIYARFDESGSDKIYYEICKVMDELNRHPLVSFSSNYCDEVERKLEKFLYCYDDICFTDIPFLRNVHMRKTFG